MDLLRMDALGSFKDGGTFHECLGTKELELDINKLIFVSYPLFIY